MDFTDDIFALALNGLIVATLVIQFISAFLQFSYQFIFPLFLQIHVLIHLKCFQKRLNYNQLSF